jgi:hypothetical protein
MKWAAFLKNSGPGYVRLENTLLYSAGGGPEDGSIAELIADAENVVSIDAPARGRNVAHAAHGCRL